MRERKPPQNFKDLIHALDIGVSEEILSLPEAEVDQLLAENGIDPSKAVANVREILKRQRGKLDCKTSGPKAPLTVRSPLTAKRRGFWTHPSILALGQDDPISFISSRASDLVLDAIQAGW